MYVFACFFACFFFFFTHVLCVDIIINKNKLIGLVILTFDLLTSKNRFTSYSCDGLPSCQFWASCAFPFSSYVKARDRQRDGRTDTAARGRA